jgi:zinc protease
MNALRRIAAGATLALMPLAALAATAQVPSSYKEIKTPPLHAFKIPQAKRVQLANGMVIYLMEDHELPLIRGTARIRGGARDVPAGKTGLAGIYAQAWRTGGTESKTGDQLDEFLEARAARVETTPGEDSTTVRMDMLKGDFDAVFPIFVDVLEHPAFRQDKIDLAKTQANTFISRRNDDPMSLGNREAAKLAYGTNSPYTRQPEYATVAAITRDDLVAFHQKYVHPNNIILGVVGDFDSNAMEAKLRQTFESWPRGPEAPKVAPPAGAPAKTGVYFVPKEDVTQSNIYLVSSGGVLRSSPDYYPVVVLDEILSGGFSGRLMNKIRSEMGLAYGVGGGVSPEWDSPGLFRIWMGTKSESTAQAVEALRDQMAALETQPFTAAELALAKESLLNSFIFTMDSKSKILNQQMNLEFYGYPADWYQHYVSGIQQVTAADVARVAQKYVHPNELSVLVVGREKDFDKPLSTLGNVSTLDVTIPEPGAAPAGAKPAASNAEGKALIDKVVNFVGGASAIQNVKAIRRVGSMSMRTPQGPMDMETEEIVSYPDSMRRVMKTPMGEMTTVITPNAAFMAAPMGTQDLPASAKTAAQGEMRQDLITVLRNVNNPEYTFSVVGTEKVGDINADVLQVNAAGSMFKWDIDPATGRILRKVSSGRMGEQVTDITEWKMVNGVNLPAALSMSVGGQPAGSGKMTTIEINPTVDPKLFEKPAPK